MLLNHWGLFQSHKLIVEDINGICGPMLNKEIVWENYSYLKKVKKS